MLANVGSINFKECTLKTAMNTENDQKTKDLVEQTMDPNMPSELQ